MTDWPVKTLGEVCDDVQRLDPAKTNSEVFTYVDLSSIDQKSKSVTGARVVSVKEAPGRARQLVRKNDVLISTVRPNLNAVALIGDSLDGAIASTGFCVLRPIQNKIDSRLVFAWIRSQRFIDELSSMATGTSYPAVTDSVVKSLEMPMPPLEEQKRIVALLDAATARVTELTACYEQARTLATSLFASALEDALEGNADSPVKNLGNLFDFQNGRGFKKTEWAKSGFPIIRIQNLNSESAPYNYFTGTFDPRILVESGDLLFSWSGSIGTSFGPHIWQRSAGLLNQHIFKVIPKVPIDTSYAHYCLRLITAEIERSVNGAVGLVHITKEKLNKFEIPVPSMEEQERIVGHLDLMKAKTSEMVATYDTKLTAAKNLRQSILEAAFGGDL